ncbi:MAG: ParB N-terminal domain-containing protein [Dehalococcoidia bacterium]
MVTGQANQVIWHQRIFGRDVIPTRRDRVDIDCIGPNERQPRQGEKHDAELRRQIDENGGVFEPLLVEPDPQQDGRYRIIDGERRWTNSKDLVDHLVAAGASAEDVDKFRLIPIETTDRTLTEEERFRIWVYIHRQRKEWSRKEKEGAAYNLARFMDRARAANVLGISLRELDKLIAIYEVSQTIRNLPDPDASITWGREIMNLSEKFRRPDDILPALINKINGGMLRNSKEVRELRRIVPNQVALVEFLSPQGTIKSALAKLPTTDGQGEAVGYGQGLLRDVATFADQLSRYSWTELEALKDDPGLRQALLDAEERLGMLKKALGNSRAKRKIKA